MILEKMAADLRVPTNFVESLARSASYEYKTYSIPKRTGGNRIIHHPSRRLKALQRWLLKNVISGLPIHDSATAYKKERSVLDNAKVHAASKYLLRMDFEKFFPSISKDDIAQYVSIHSSRFDAWTPADIDAFCSLVCRHSELTIGAPTSPSLSNAICYELDTRINGLCSAASVKYTRYADDLFFSTNKSGVLRSLEQGVRSVVDELILPANLRFNEKKSRHSSKKGRRKVTGIILGSDGQPHIGRDLKRKVRALIHQFEKLDHPQRATLAGMIAYTTGLDPQFMNNLIEKYGLPKIREARQLRG